ncbi:ABC transporter permease [Dehalococcoidia bacterium]|nr:ABC transporter permease [Dehalococcoidia bacterium]
MQQLFGIPIDSLATYLAITFAMLVSILLVLSLRNPILVKLGVRNIPKRPAQSVLIVIGLTLSTVIIGASLGIGDTVYNSIRVTALEASGYVDETIVSSSRRFSTTRYFPEDRIDVFDNMFDGDPRVDGIISRIGTSLPAMNPGTNRTESRMTIRGYRADRQQNFGAITSIDGRQILLSDLANDEVILNKNAAEALEASSGDIIKLYTGTDVSSYVVRLVAEHGGLASGGSTRLILMSLKQIQELTEKRELIDWIGISNQGGIEEGLSFSEDIAQILRAALIDEKIAVQIATIIDSNGMTQSIAGKLDDPAFARNTLMSDQTIANIRVVVNEISKGNYSSDQYLGLIADESNLDGILSIISQLEQFQDQAKEIGFLMPRLNQMNVKETKADALRLAETIGTSVTTLFTIFGSFSIIVGLLLIFLVMVLLASSRSMEMGMARAIGLKRRHLVQIFTFEGTVYALGAAAIGTAIGALVSVVLVGLLQQAVAGDGEWPIRNSFTIQSAWITFATGFLLTLITIGISAYRVSRLNIVVAIRGLNEQLALKPKIPLKQSLLVAAIGFLGPVYVLVGFRDGFTMRKINAVIISTTLWPFSIARQLIRVVRFVLTQDWILILLGIALHRLGINLGNGTLFSVGSSISIIGLGLLLRRILIRSKLAPRTVNQIAATVEGALLMLFWGLPFDTFEAYTGLLNTTPDIFVLSGVAQIGSAVWLIMNNSGVLLALSNRTLGRLSGLQATFRTAIAYPVAASFRTGLTVSMFGLVVFTLMIFAVLNNINNVAREQPNRVTGGYDIVASVRPEFSMSIEELQTSITDSRDLSTDQFEVIAGSVNIPAIAREMRGDNKQFSSLTLRSVDDAYLRNTLLEFAKVHPDYNDQHAGVWNALADNPSFAVVSYSALPTNDPFAPAVDDLQINTLPQDSEEDYWPEGGVNIEILPAQGTGEPISVEVIGVIDSLADQQSFGRSVYIVTGETIGNAVFPDFGGYDTYNMMLSSDVQASQLVPYLETVFVEHGMKAISTIDQIEKGLETRDAFNKLFQGFMGLGLVVGVIAIGVLSIRAVVERRQAIGIMRAIGYKARMVWLSFLLESLYITFLGILLGLGLGALTSWNIFTEISKEVEGITYKIPWANVMVIVGITMFFALLSSFVPARQASKIYPAEALRYE